MLDVMHRGHQNLSDSGAQLMQTTRWGVEALSIPDGWMCDTLLCKQGWCRPFLILCRETLLPYSILDTAVSRSFPFNLERYCFVLEWGLPLLDIWGVQLSQRHTARRMLIKMSSKLVGFKGFDLDLICLKSPTHLALECSDDCSSLCSKELW